MTDTDRDEQMLDALSALVAAAEYSELNENGDAVGIARFLIANRTAVLRALGAWEVRGRGMTDGMRFFRTEWEDAPGLADDTATGGEG